MEKINKIKAIRILILIFLLIIIISLIVYLFPVMRNLSTYEGQLEFKNGDITYCPSNNTIAIFYGQAEDPDMGQLTMRVIPIGQITSDLSVFNELDNRMNFIFENNQ